MRNDLDYRDGYDAGWEFHMGSGRLITPPDEIYFNDERRAQWDRGFDDAGQDS